MNLTRNLVLATLGTAAIYLTGCTSHSPEEIARLQTNANFYGTLNPYAAEQVYFALTDRFVDGDPSNNQEDQGGKYPTFNRPLVGPNGQQANVGYLGGDFKGVLNLSLIHI